MAVQGGLLASSIDNQGDTSIGKKENIKHVLLFLTAKLIAYTILGFLLGFIGSFLIISIKIQIVLQILIGIFLIGTAARLLDIHPFFRHFTITPPKFIFRLLKKESGKNSSFTPAFLGALTVLIPCGITQAMMMEAIATGSPIKAGAIMFAFILGTSPVFFLLGLAAVEMFKRKIFTGIAAGIIFIFGILSFNNAIALSGSLYTIQNLYGVITNKEIVYPDSTPKTNKKGVQEITVYITGQGYTSDINTLKANVPVRLTLKSDNSAGCARAFTIPSLGIRKVLAPNAEETIEFTPTKTGILFYSCSMGMYTGSFRVVN